MDQETAQAIADLRYQLGQLRTAIGAGNPDQAEAKVQQLAQTAEALAEWGATVTPPFTPPGGP